MRVCTRWLLVMMLALLLPLQGSLAYARSAATLGKLLPNPSAAGKPAHALNHYPLTAAAAHAVHGAHSAHQHHPQHHSASAAHADAVAQDFTQSPPSPHKHASNACDNCAKCCLAGAAAPPSASLPSPDAPAVRIAFKPAASILRGFIADGPERPPRHRPA